MASESNGTSTKSTMDDLDAALDKALAIDRAPAKEKQEEPKEQPVEKEESKDVEESTATTTEGEKEETGSEGTVTPEAPKEEPIKAPAEFNKEEKAAWEKGDTKQVLKAFERIHKSRTANFSRAQAAIQQEYGTMKELADRIKPYIEASGNNGKDPYRALTEAVAAVQMINSNPKLALKQILQMKGLTLEELQDDSAEDKTSSKIEPIQARLNQLEQELKRRENEGVQRQFVDVFTSLQTEKAANGANRFLDLQDTEEGKQLAFDIGSQLRDQAWVERTKRRMPTAGLRELVVEAYKYLGGRIDESKESPQQKTEEIKRAKSASASVPGRSSSIPGKFGKKAKTLEEAVDAAFEAYYSNHS